MHLEIFAMLVRGERELGRTHRIIAEDRQFFEHQPNLSVFVNKFEHVGKRVAAIGAVIVKKLCHAHVAIGVASHMGNRRPEDRIGILRDCFLLLHRLLGGLPLIELIRHLDQDFGFVDEVVANDPLDPLRVGRFRFQRSVAKNEIARTRRRHRGHNCSQGRVDENIIGFHFLNPL